MSAKLYVILGSHACRAGILMLDHKGVVYEIVTLPAGLHPFLVRLHGFPGNVTRVAGDKHPKSLALMNRLGTVPALRYGADRIQTNHEIARFLDRVRPDPPLFPADPERRSAVEEAERWGDEVLQMAARRLVSAAGMHGPDALIDRGSSGRLGPLLVRNEALRRWGAARVVRTTFAADLEAENELLASLPGMLDRIDAWIEGGVLNGPELNAADFMIAPSVAFLCHRRDLVQKIEARPVAELIDRLLPAPAGAPSPAHA